MVFYRIAGDRIKRRSKMALKQPQIDFIKQKVRELGSMEKVRAFYQPKRSKLSVVEQFAWDYADEIFPVKHARTKP